MTWQTLFGERATTKIAAIYDTQASASAAAESLGGLAHLEPWQWQLIGPTDKEDSLARKLEPEPQGIARTGVRAHLILGAMGLVAGVVLWGVLYGLAIPFIVSSALASAAVIVAFATILGMMLGGLVTARPDHEIVILKVRKAAEQAQWSLVLHPRNPGQCDVLIKALSDADVEFVRTV